MTVSERDLSGHNEEATPTHGPCGDPDDTPTRYLKPYEAIVCNCEENGGMVLRSNFCWYFEIYCLYCEQFFGSLQTILTISL